MMKTSEESQVIAQAGTTANDLGDTEVLTPAQKIVSPVIVAASPFELGLSNEKHIRIGAIRHGYLALVVERSGDVLLTLGAIAECGGRYEVQITGNARDGLTVTGDVPGVRK